MYELNRKQGDGKHEEQGNNADNDLAIQGHCAIWEN